MVRTRFAPSPTGMMHIGSVRTALYAFLVAKKNKGTFFLRIEDTDRKRAVEGATEDIINNLKWLGLDFKELVVQSERQELYKKYANELVSKKLAYESEGAIWFKVPKTGRIVYTDLIGNRRIEFENSSQKDFVILKSDGFPTYHLAHVVDDHLMQINPVIRAEEWMPSTPKHIMLFEAFGWEIPEYAHLPLILGTDRSKLSKRHGAKGVSEFRKDGFLPQAILNYMALLGWTPPNGEEFLTLDEMIDVFDLKDVHISPAIFDLKKLEWMNGIYIRQAKLDELRSKIKDQRSKITIDENLLDRFIPLAQDRMTTLNDFYDLVFPLISSQKPELSDKERMVAKKLLEKFLRIQQWNNEAIFSAFKEVMAEEKIKMPLIYKIITGKEKGLPLPQSLEILGKEEVAKRLKNSL